MRLIWIVPTILTSSQLFAESEWVWVEGKNPTQANVIRQPWWYDQVNKQELSGGDHISH